MTSSAVRWFVQTAGSAPGQGIRWIALDPSDDAAFATAMFYETVGGQHLVDLTLEGTESVVLGRCADGSFLFYAGGLRHDNAPTGGDHQGRTIYVAVLGHAAPGAPVTPLIDAAAAALNGELASSLPLAWNADGPHVDGDWTPPSLIDDVTGAVDLSSSVAMPSTEKSALLTALAGLRRVDLHSFPMDRLLLLVSDLVAPAQFGALRPWRAVSTRLTTSTDLKESKRDRTRELVILAGLATFGLVILIYFLIRGRR